MMERQELKLTEEDHHKAFTEVSFLLEILSRTMDDLVGRSAPSLAVNAGRQMGRRLPVRLEDDGVETVIAALAKYLRDGFDVSSSYDGDRTVTMEVGPCAIREVCTNRGLEVGGALCNTYHYYFSGMAAQLMGRAVRPKTESAGSTCRVSLQIAPKRD